MLIYKPNKRRSSVYSSGTVRDPSSISFCKSTGDFPFTVHPMENAVPRTSFTVPFNFLAIDLNLNILAMFITESNVMFPLCMIFITFSLSLGASFSSFIINAEAVGTIVGVA